LGGFIAFHCSGREAAWEASSVNSPGAANRPRQESPPKVRPAKTLVLSFLEKGRLRNFDAQSALQSATLKLLFSRRLDELL